MNDHYDIPSMSLVMTELKNKALLYKKRRENLEKWKDVLYVMDVSKTSFVRYGCLKDVSQTPFVHWE